MRSNNDHVFGNSIESNEENTELKILENGTETGCELFHYTRGDEWDKENYGNMSGHHSSEFKIDTKNEGIKKNPHSLEDPSVFYMDKNVMACELPEIVVSSYEELTYNVVKDICVDEGVPALMQEKFLLNEKDSVKVNVNPFESESSGDRKYEEFAGIQDSSKLNQENLIVKEAKDDSKVLPRDGVATSRSISKEALTLGDIISMEDSRKPLNNNNINGPEENVVHETEQEKTEEPKASNLRYFSSEMEEPENQRPNNVLEDSFDHSLFSSNFSNDFGERSFPEAESGLALITYSGSISVSGSLSVRSDGSTVSAHSFSFPILQSEWNSSPVRMVKAEKPQLGKEKGWRHYSLLLCCKFGWILPFSHGFYFYRVYSIYTDGSKTKFLGLKYFSVDSES